MGPGFRSHDQRPPDVLATRIGIDVPGLQIADAGNAIGTIVISFLEDGNQMDSVR